MKPSPVRMSRKQYTEGRASKEALTAESWASEGSRSQSHTQDPSARRPRLGSLGPRVFRASRRLPLTLFSTQPFLCLGTCFWSEGTCASGHKAYTLVRCRRARDAGKCTRPRSRQSPVAMGTRLPSARSPVPGVCADGPGSSRACRVASDAQTSTGSISRPRGVSLGREEAQGLQVERSSWAGVFSSRQRAGSRLWKLERTERHAPRGGRVGDAGTQPRRPRGCRAHRQKHSQTLQFTLTCPGKQEGTRRERVEPCSPKDVWSPIPVSAASPGARGLAEATSLG